MCVFSSELISFVLNRAKSQGSVFWISALASSTCALPLRGALPFSQNVLKIPTSDPPPAEQGGLGSQELSHPKHYTPLHQIGCLNNFRSMHPLSSDAWACLGTELRTSCSKWDSHCNKLSPAHCITLHTHSVALELLSLCWLFPVGLTLCWFITNMHQMMSRVVRWLTFNLRLICS